VQSRPISQKVILVFIAIAIAPVSAGAVTITSFGTLANNQSYNAGDVNLASDSVFRWDGYVNGTASFSANTYVNPLLEVGLGAANVLIGVVGSSVLSVSGTWGSDNIVFTQIGSTWQANFSTNFLQAGLAGAQLLSISWVGASNDQFSLNLAAVPSSVPIPAALPLLATAIGGLSVMGWRKKRRGDTA
jgi:hypothetical protein